MADTTIEPFVRNAWYLAAWPEELAEGMVSRTIMNEPLVLFRDASGAVAALEDRCCHRGAPLTHGEVVPEGIQCGYHGLVFDCTGACVKVPGQDTIPRKAMVRSYLRGRAAAIYLDLDGRSGAGRCVADYRLFPITISRTSGRIARRCFPLKPTT